MQMWEKAKHAVRTAIAPTTEERDGHVVRDERLTDLMRQAIERFEDADDTTMVWTLAETPDDVPPPPGVARRNWIRNHIERAFSYPKTSATYDLRGEFHDVVDRALHDVKRLETVLDSGNLHALNEAIAHGVASRYVAISDTGLRLIRRVEAEATHLAPLDDETIAHRFELGPAARLDAIPLGDEERRDWVRDMLIGENLMVRTGAMSPADARAASRRITVPIEQHNPPTDTRIVVDNHVHCGGTFERRMIHQATLLRLQADDALKTRFSKLRGVHEIPKTPSEREAWIRRALTAEHIQTLRQQGGRDASTTTALRVELSDIVASEAAGLLSYTGTLRVDGEAICTVSTTGGGALTGGEWRLGTIETDLEVISDHIGRTMPPRHDGAGERADTLEETLLDQVVRHLALCGYRSSSAYAVMFVDDMDTMELLSVPIPLGGSRGGAQDHVRALHPGATLLDDLDEDTQALIWAIAMRRDRPQ